MLRALGLAPLPRPNPLPPSLHTPCRSWMLLCYQAGATERRCSLGQSLVLFSLSLCVEASPWEVAEARQSQDRRRRCGQVQRGCPRLWSPRLLQLGGRRTTNSPDPQSLAS